MIHCRHRRRQRNTWRTCVADSEFGCSAAGSFHWAARNCGDRTGRRTILHTSPSRNRHAHMRSTCADLTKYTTCNSSANNCEALTLTHCRSSTKYSGPCNSFDCLGHSKSYKIRHKLNYEMVKMFILLLYILIWYMALKFMAILILRNLYRLIILSNKLLRKNCKTNH